MSIERVWIKSEALRWVVPHVDDGRGRFDNPILTSIHLANDGLLVATDARTMAVYRNGHDSSIDRNIYINASKAIKLLGRGRKMAKELIALCDNMTGEVTCRVDGKDESIPGTWSEGAEYPNFRSIFPVDEGEYTRTVTMLNLDYLSRFHKGMTQDKPKVPAITLFTAGNSILEKKSPVVVVPPRQPDAWGMIAPIYFDTSEISPQRLPEWLVTHEEDAS